MTDKGHISKLHLFAKDTDAPDVIKGFKYQELKTLEVWLYNKVNGIEELIYCDFEEDIFKRDLKDFKSTFKQLKLYSSKKFSFSSEEITKSLTHFFMLFVKGEYLLDDPLFIFETNSSVAGKKGDNDAELLEEWVANQANLSDVLLRKCVAKLKSILDLYINEQYRRLEKENKSSDILLAKAVYEELPQATWELFVKSIRWIFDGISSEEAISSSIHNSLGLISQLPFPLRKEDYSLVFDRLRGVVGDRSMQSKPEDRVLTNKLLDKQLLGLGDKDDKIYIQSFELWKDVEKINFFKVSEFYQVLFAAKHCRRNLYLKEHSKIWLQHLSYYYNYPDTIRKLKRESIYEIIWLTLRPVVEEAPRNTLKGLEVLVYDYFSDLENFTDLANIEDALNLLTILATSQKFDLIDIEESQIIDWYNRFDSLVEECKSSSPDRNIYCGLLEIESFSYLNKNSLGIGTDNKEKALISLNKIIDELPNAHRYAVSQLGGRIDAIVDLLIRFGIEGDVSELEAYSEVLLPYVKEREGDFSAAKRYTEKALNYLHSPNPKGILKSLDFFHKAKDLYQNEATYDGFVLAVMGISQLYAAIGMNMAAKYYSLSVIWFCFQHEDSKLLKRISDAYSLLFYSDFKQGSWMSALQDFENYICTRSEFDPSELNLETDELFRKTVFDSAFILALTPIISNQLSNFIEFEKKQMGNLYPDILKDFVEYLEKESITIGLSELISHKLDNPPINDIGLKRRISWIAFGSQWNVEFKNDYYGNSIGEEYASFIQIVQAEIALRGIDFNLTIGNIHIEIELNDTLKEPEQLPSNSDYDWIVFLPILNSKEPADKTMHYGLITVSFQMILNELSLLPNEQFQSQFQSLLEKGLSTRALILNAYQRIYRDLFSEKKFNEFMRDKFNSEVLSIEQHESSLITSIKTDSPLYNHNQSLENIKGRYNNCLKAIYISVERLKQSEDFKSKLIELKKEGWLDWQIVLALYNNINDLKAKNILRQNGKSYNSDEEWLKDFQRVFHEIRFKDEKETYVEIPLSEIIGENLHFQLQQVSFHVLGSFKLENKSRFPNFKSIKNFLNQRFRFDVDEFEELSPFKENEKAPQASNDLSQ